MKLRDISLWIVGGDYIGLFRMRIDQMFVYTNKNSIQTLNNWGNTILWP